MTSKQEIEHLHIKEITILALILIFVVSTVAYKSGNIEFFYYCLVALPFLAFFYFAHKKLHITVHIFILGFIFGFLHFAGGMIGLYEKTFYGLGYDNITHIYGAFVMTLLAYNFIRAHWEETPRVGNYYLFLTIFLVGLGIGALMEIIEFCAVLGFNAPGVGGYFNNALDLVRDGIGAAIGAGLMIYLHHKN